MAIATLLPLMLVGRVIQGAAGGVFPLAFGIIRDEFPGERVAGAVGVLSALAGVGGGAGVILAGPIADHLFYHWLFWLPRAALVPATFAVHLFVPESPVRVGGRVILLPDYVETPRSAGYGFGASVTGAGLFLIPTTSAMLVAGSQTGRLERCFGS